MHAGAALRDASSPSPRKRPSIAIIILNYRTADLTIDCLGSLAGQTDADTPVIVVDNDSGDGSAERIERYVQESGLGDWMKVVRSPMNGGFAAGNNFAIRDIDAESYLLLNSDTVVRDGAVAAFLQAMHDRPDAGIIGPRIEDLDGTPQFSAFRNHTPATELLRSARTGPITRLFRGRDVLLPLADQPFEAEWVAFACVLIRREVIDRIGLLDDGYFMYFEDVDFCRRARQAGFKILYCPIPRVAHIAGASSHVTGASSTGKRLPRYFYEARSRYFGKFHGRHGLLGANAMFAVGRAVALVLEVLGRPLSHLHIRESLDIWTNSLSPFKPSLARADDPDGLPYGNTNQNPSDVGFLELLAEDYRTYDRNPLEPGFWAVATHRFGNWRMDIKPKVARAPLTLVYKVAHHSIDWLWGIDLEYTVKVGRRLRLWHHGGMVLAPRAIGNDVVIQHSVTMGKHRLGEIGHRPVIEDAVEIGTGACILGNITIGHDSVIGENAVVLQSFPPYSMITGIPARAIGQQQDEQGEVPVTPRSGFFRSSE